MHGRRSVQLSHHAVWPFRNSNASSQSEVHAQQNLMGRKKHDYQQRSRSSSHPKQPKKCGVLCCGSSRLSVSSSSSSVVSEFEQLNSVSNFMHAMVQARLERMIKDRAAAAGARSRRDGGGRYVILVAMDKTSYDPRRDFRESMLEIIASKGLTDPKELRSLLNCYISMNSCEHHQLILETFLDVCCSMFT